MKDFHGAKLKRRPRFPYILILAIILLLGGGYLLVLVLTPNIAQVVPVKTKVDLNTDDDANDKSNRIQIEKINLEVAFYDGDQSVLDRGAWHRHPERGNPEKGGNFILSAHRFNIGTTPAQTKERSPFYNINQLKVGDTLKVFYDESWYTYRIDRLYDVKPDAIEIEAPSETAKLTLYSCTLSGSSDGRNVIEATRV